MLGQQPAAVAAAAADANAAAASFFWDQYARFSHVHSQTYAFTAAQLHTISPGIAQHSGSGRSRSVTETSAAPSSDDDSATTPIASRVASATPIVGVAPHPTRPSSPQQDNTSSHVEHVAASYDNFTQRLKISRERWRSSVFEILAADFPLPPDRLVRSSLGSHFRIASLSSSTAAEQSLLNVADTSRLVPGEDNGVDHSLAGLSTSIATGNVSDDGLPRLDYNVHIVHRQPFVTPGGYSLQFIATADLSVGPFTFPELGFFKVILPPVAAPNHSLHAKPTVKSSKMNVNVNVPGDVPAVYVKQESSSTVDEISNSNDADVEDDSNNNKNEEIDDNHNKNEVDDSNNTIKAIDNSETLQTTNPTDAEPVKSISDDGPPVIIPPANVPSLVSAGAIAMQTEAILHKGLPFIAQNRLEGVSPPSAGVNRLSSLLAPLSNDNVNNIATGNSSMLSNTDTASLPRSESVASMDGNAPQKRIRPPKPERPLIAMFLGGKYRVLPTDGLIDGGIIAGYLPPNGKVHNQQGVIFRLLNASNDELLFSAIREVFPTDIYGQVRKFRNRMIGALTASKANPCLVHPRESFILDEKDALSDKWLNDPRFKVEPAKVYSIRRPRQHNAPLNDMSTTNDSGTARSNVNALPSNVEQEKNSTNTPQQFVEPGLVGIDNSVDQIPNSPSKRIEDEPMDPFSPSKRRKLSATIAATYMLAMPDHRSAKLFTETTDTSSVPISTALIETKVDNEHTENSCEQTSAITDDIDIDGTSSAINAELNSSPKDKQSSNGDENMDAIKLSQVENPPNNFQTSLPKRKTSPLKTSTKKVKSPQSGSTSKKGSKDSSQEETSSSRASSEPSSPSGSQKVVEMKLLPKSEPGTTCAACGTNQTPLWRRGPHGQKTLCNACGVKFMHGRIKFVE